MTQKDVVHLEILRKRMRKIENDKTKCFWCGEELKEGEATKDHVLPKRSGYTRQNNRVYSCLFCNQAKDDMIPEDFEKTDHYKFWCRSLTPYKNWKKLLLELKSFSNSINKEFFINDLENK